MTRWDVFAALCYGAIFVIFAVLRRGPIVGDTTGVLLSVFLFGSYCGIVAFGTDGKRPWLSLSRQTLLGVLVALAIGAMHTTSIEGFIGASIIGLLLGFTADMWVKHIRPP
ncbi:hypothetical protein [Arenimonas sp.]|uniref:hypothetical protein n=1 Tax=Arenimonas sp. TaxID=1872635 RepID=UPI0039E6825C